MNNMNNNNNNYPRIEVAMCNCYKFAYIAGFRTTANISPKMSERQTVIRLVMHKSLKQSFAKYSNYNNLSSLEIKFITRKDSFGNPYKVEYNKSDKRCEKSIYEKCLDYTGGYTDAEDYVQELAIEACAYITRGENPLEYGAYWKKAYSYINNYSYTPTVENKHTGFSGSMVPETPNNRSAKKDCTNVTNSDFEIWYDVLDNGFEGKFISDLKLSLLEENIIYLRAMGYSYTEIAKIANVSYDKIANTLKSISHKACESFGCDFSTMTEIYQDNGRGDRWYVKPDRSKVCTNPFVYIYNNNTYTGQSMLIKALEYDNICSGSKAKKVLSGISVNETRSINGVAIIRVS